MLPQKMRRGAALRTGAADCCANTAPFIDFIYLTRPCTPADRGAPASTFIGNSVTSG